ncbi:DUF1214 domain-containing protein [Gordonia aquimaris]|uniref:DUF1214 domain-containing protein n=1 Tax=Gordonia aquimaris TaxID=2984863 RepID=A0A9X3D6W8_9ACTN|nr:DUF1214 domain-containing protein [Gordonia aquimaris]MCX2965807.1 DUF1214 domain-containing protein [Gordonia aquimaris]
MSSTARRSPSSSSSATESPPPPITTRSATKPAYCSTAARPGGYVLTFPASVIPEASRLWLLTADTPNSVEMILNPINKYVVAGYPPGLVRNRDGSISIHIARVRPPGVPEANWLPVGFRPFNVMLRLYLVVPGSAAANNTYVPPPVVPR